MATTLVRKLLLEIKADDVDAETKLEAIKAKADEFRTLHPELSVRLDTAEANAKMAVLREELKREAGTVKVKVEPDVSVFRSLMGKAAGWLTANPFTAASGSGGGGILSRIGGLAGSSPEGLAVVAAAVAALSTEVTGLATGVAAAGAGLGALGLVALPTLDKIKNAYTGISTAQQAYNSALAMEKEFPTKAHAAAAATALQKLQVAQEQAGPGISGAVSGVEKLVAAFEKMAASFQPQILGIFNEGLKIAGSLLPAVSVLAKAAAPAVLSVAQSIEKAVSGPGFKKFIDQMASVAPVAIRQLGSLLGMITADLGRFLSLMGKQDVYNAFRVAIDAVDTVLKVLILGVKFVMTTWDVAWDLMTGRTQKAGNAISSFVKTIPSRILNDLEGLPGLLVRSGESLIEGLAKGIRSAAGSALDSAMHFAGSLISDFLPRSPAKRGPLSGAGSPDLAGERIARMLGQGMTRGSAHVAAGAYALGMAAGLPGGGGSGGGGRGGYGGRIQLEWAPGTDSAIVTGLKKSIRVRGGDPAVIGR